MPATTKEPKPMESVLRTTPIDEYEALRAKRAAELKAAKPELRKCLDAEYAAQKEAEKPIYTYRIACTVNEGKPGAMRAKDYEDTVRAKDPDEAWAKFCDKIERWPSPDDSDRTIEKV